jgi:hypothetical protein
VEAVAEPLAALALASITLDGVALDLSTVVADVTIRHGRAGYFDSPNAATCQLTLTGVSRAVSSAVTLARPLIVNVTDGTTTFPRFTGKTTDANLDGDALSLVAVGELSRLEMVMVGVHYFNPGNWSQRVKDLFQYSGYSGRYVVATPKTDPYMPFMDVVANEQPTLADALNDLLPFMGAALVDLPDGRLMVQAASSRTTASAANIPPADVLYAPGWVMVLPGANDVTLTYSNGLGDQLPMNEFDWNSMQRFGDRVLKMDTPSTESTAVDTLALEMVHRQAWPKWVIEEATLLKGYVLSIGQPVRLSGFPAAAPHSSWVGIVEGWTDHIYSDGSILRWTTDVSLSDPALSGIGEQPITWNDTPTDITWSNMNQVTAWNDALDVDDLYP